MEVLLCSDAHIIIGHHLCQFHLHVSCLPLIILQLSYGSPFAGPHMLGERSIFNKTIYQLPHMLQWTRHRKSSTLKDSSPNWSLTHGRTRFVYFLFWLLLSTSSFERGGGYASRNLVWTLWPDFYVLVSWLKYETFLYAIYRKEVARVLYLHCSVLMAVIDTRDKPVVVPPHIPAHQEGLALQFPEFHPCQLHLFETILLWFWMFQKREATLWMAINRMDDTYRNLSLENS